MLPKLLHDLAITQVKDRYSPFGDIFNDRSWASSHSIGIAVSIKHPRYNSVAVTLDKSRLHLNFCSRNPGKLGNWSRPKLEPTADELRAFVAYLFCIDSTLMGMTHPNGCIRRFFIEPQVASPFISIAF